MAVDAMINREKAYALIPEQEVMELINGIRKSSVAMQLMRRLPNMSTRVGRVPVLEMLPSADFVDGDAGMKITTEMAWDKKQLVVGEIAAIVPIPDAVVDDAEYDIWAQVRPALIEKIGRVFDNQVFNGGNPKAPVEWPQGLIPQAISAGHIVTMGGGQDTLDDINSLFGMIEENEFNVTGLAAQMSLRSRLRNVRDANGGFLFASPTSGSDNNPFGVPVHYIGRGTWNAATATAIAGDWGNAVYAVRQDITFKIFDTGVISDDDGKVVYNLLQQDMKAMRVVFRVAWQSVSPIDIDRVDANRRNLKIFPFAIMQPGVVTP